MQHLPLGLSLSLALALSAVSQERLFHPDDRPLRADADTVAGPLSAPAGPPAR